MPKLTRRHFLYSAGLAAAHASVPEFLACSAPRAQIASGGGSDKRRLVVVQLSGGNDGLNTLAPTGSAAYRELRPTLGLKPAQTIRIDGDHGWHPALTGLAALYDEGLVGVYRGVGYPNPQHSHFRSLDIWHTATANGQSSGTTGWLGRYLDAYCAGEPAHHVVDFNATSSLAVQGERASGFSMGALVPNSSLLDRLPEAGGTLGDDAYVAKVLTDARSSTRYLIDHIKQRRAGSDYPRTPLGKQLRDVANLVLSDADTKVYYTSMGGFDTHDRQGRRHERLLGQYGDAVRYFVEDLRQNGALADTLILTFSEFGRRAYENGSGGTDHGAGNLAWVIGGSLRERGLLNDGDALSRLDEGNVAARVDFRGLYATILERWLGVPHEPIVGRRDLLGFV